MKRKKIIINADDVGLHPQVDHAIAALAKRGVVSSASVMSLGSPNRDALGAMADGGIDFGLHLDFTSSFANRRYNTAYSVKSLIIAAWQRRLDRVHIRNVINEQLDKFGQLIGTSPSFIDGHEHIHQFPIIREALFEILRERYPHQRFFIRNTKPASWRGTKAAIIAALGAAETRRRAYDAGYQCNTDFGGVYDFNPASDLHGLWSGWLGAMQSNGGLIICHPARSLLEDDPIAPARVREFQFLASDECAELLSKHAVQVTGWNEALVSD
jgi:predicted glycoside hydrolase/deacetylase ChbG (UPF0249 family)